MGFSLFPFGSSEGPKYGGLGPFSPTHDLRGFCADLGVFRRFRGAETPSKHRLNRAILAKTLQIWSKRRDSVMMDLEVLWSLNLDSMDKSCHPGAQT
tara:strand:+ start:130 stop:420 length:291 start_codon:yes stop_codon:yes gene_type:complete